jgi:aminoglycoside phosphotransferase (APT) family kinase protein
MISDVTPDAAAISQLLRRINPELELTQARPLHGGVSARVTALDAVSPAGLTAHLVIREYGARDRERDPQIAAHEYHLLSLLRAAGLPVPAPVLADESGTVLPGPYLVTEFVDGTAMIDPARSALAPEAVIAQLAGALARIHTAPVALAALGHLRDIADRATARISERTSALDESLSEPAIRAALAQIWPPPVVSDRVLLHGDYWPGNTLWRDGVLVAVIDWEDAATGDTVADLGNARMELCIGYGQAAAAEFTRQYCALRPGVDLGTLPHWDLYAALRHTGRMGGWGLPAAELARLQAGHREFVAMVTAGR